MFYLLTENYSLSEEKYHILNYVYSKLNYVNASEVTLNVISLRILICKVTESQSEYIELIEKLPQTILHNPKIKLTLEIVQNIEMGNYDACFKKATSLSQIHFLCIKKLKNI